MRKETVLKRIWNAVVTFKRPFILDGFGQVQPAGAYSVDTEEEKLGGSAEGVETWRRLDTRIRLIRNGTTKDVSVHPAALAAALERDNAQADDSSVENTAKSRLSVARKLNPFPSRLSKYSL